MSSLVQVVNNMIINSIHSYKGKGGVIRLTARTMADRLIIAVVDKGEGMKDSVKKCLFKQMVTTKGKEGTGLGLYISYSTIKHSLEEKCGLNQSMEMVHHFIYQYQFCHNHKKYVLIFISV